MAVVLSSTEERDYFRSSSIRRSHSQPRKFSHTSSFRRSSSSSKLASTYATPIKICTSSAPSSAPSSPRTASAGPASTDVSCASTPASILSVTEDCDNAIQFGLVDDEHDYALQTYVADDYFGCTDDLRPPPPPPPCSSPMATDSYPISPTTAETPNNTSRPPSPWLEFIRAEDDLAANQRPSRHVDYLSHDWKEEDIWSSWKYIVSQRGEINNSARLENASWRTWIKAKNKLKTVSPDTLNWLKDCDVTWLYGPLQTGTSDLFCTETKVDSPRLSHTNSFINKKPILKKRSMSEIMLQRSLSSSSLLKQATASVWAQQKDGLISRPALLQRATTADYITFSISTARSSQDSTSLATSSASSGNMSPSSSERRHISFNEQVEQCIAVEAKSYDDEYVDSIRYGESDSSDGPIMMKRSRTKKRASLAKETAKKRTSLESKTIAMLPSTTLKYRDEVLEIRDTAMRHSTSPGRCLARTSSAETLRPSGSSGPSGPCGYPPASASSTAVTAVPAVPAGQTRRHSEQPQSTGLLFDDDGGDDAFDNAMDPMIEWQMPNFGGASSLDECELARSPSSTSISSYEAAAAVMRRPGLGTPSLFLDGEATVMTQDPNGGFFGKVIDTVNTAKDIAHVIWNVGWRK